MAPARTGDRVGRLPGCLIIAAVLACAPTSHVSAQTPLVLNLQLQFDPKQRKPVAFELDHGHIVFQAQVDGRNVWAMLDNGAARTLVDTGFANASGFHMSGPVGQLNTPTGTLQISLVPDVEIKIPGQGSIRATVAAADLSNVSKDTGRPISVVVGKELFEILAFVIRPTNKTFEVWPSTVQALPPQAPHLSLPPNAEPIVLDNDMPQVDASISGKPAVLFVDLGDSGTISLSEAAWRRLELDNSATTKGMAIHAYGRPVPAKTTIVGTVTVGPEKGYNASVTARPILPEDGDGRLGMGFFSHYDFAMDLRARRIWLLANAASGQPLHVPEDAAALESDQQIEADAKRAVRIYQSGHKAEAEKLLATLRPMARSDIAANSLCWVEAIAGVSLDSAVQLCRDAVEQSNRNPNYVDSLGMALLQSGKLDEALAAYTEAIDKGHVASSYMGRAIIYARKGDIARAQADLAEAKKRDAAIEQRFAGYGLRLDSPPTSAAAR